jgi:hypothetical protein
MPHRLPPFCCEDQDRDWAGSNTSRTSGLHICQGKKGRRAWFDPDEYQRLHEATARRIKEGKRRGWKSKYQDLHDYVLIMANTGWRPDESWKVEFRDVDVKIEDDYGTKQTIPVTDIRGKTGVRYNKSLPGAVYSFKRLHERRTQELKGLGENRSQNRRPAPDNRALPEIHPVRF